MLRLDGKNSLLNLTRSRPRRNLPETYRCGGVSWNRRSPLIEAPEAATGQSAGKARLFDIGASFRLTFAGCRGARPQDNVNAAPQWISLGQPAELSSGEVQKSPCADLIEPQAHASAWGSPHWRPSYGSRPYILDHPIPENPTSYWFRS